MPVSSPVRALIYVQHLLGIGHLQRSLQLAAGLAQQGFEVELASGGRPHALFKAESVKLRQLPPVYSPDGNFSHLLDSNDEEIDEHWRSTRRQQLLDIFTAFAPQVLITETFPFGRRMMRFELIPLLEAARKQSQDIQIIASIRDILQPKSKPGRNQEICDLIERYYDHVLVHGDSQVACLADSFELADRIADKVSYSGYISQSKNQLAAEGDGLDEVLVSAGGSATGLAILKTAIAARPLSSLNHLHWRILVSPSIDEVQFQMLANLSDEGISIERNRPDFGELMQRARLSISQAGYNTVTDILGSKVAAVVIPYAEADEIEQSKRANILQHCGRLVALSQDRLSVSSLCNAIEQACNLNTTLEVNLAGATNSAKLIYRWLQQKETAK